MEIDEIYLKIGEFGFRQKLCTFFILCGQICAATHMVFMAFAGRAAQTLVCRSDREDGNVPPVVFHNESAACLAQKKGDCDWFELDYEWSSITTEWSLLCSQSYKVQLAQAVFMGGNMIGCFFWGYVADTYGRRKTVFITVFIICICSFVTELASSYHQFIFIRFWVGFAVAGHGTATFVLATELIGPNYRSLLGLGINAFFAVGIAILVLLDATSLNWRQLSNRVSFLNVIIFLPYVTLLESPRWLLSKNRVNECKDIFTKIARSNGSHFDVIGSDIRLINPAKSIRNSDQSIINIFKYCKTSVWTLIQMFIWFSTSAVYYGLTMAGDSLNSDLRLSVFLSGLIELPGYLFITKLITKYERKQLLLAFMLITSFSCFSVRLCEEIVTLQLYKLYIANIGKLFVSIIFPIIYVYSLELFPTIIRNSGFGLCTAAARLGSVVTPFISLLDKQHPSQQFTVFALLCFTSSAVIRYLPETKDLPLPETLSDLLLLSNKKEKLIEKNKIHV